MVEINDNAPERKIRKIVLHKDTICDEIDSQTYKYVEANAEGDVRQQNAVASDQEETLDGSIISRLMEYRDSLLRSLLISNLSQEEVLVVDDLIREEPTYEYVLSLPKDFNDAGLKPLANLMHKYIVWGSLFDWYSQMGKGEANAYGNQLRDIESKIKSSFCQPGYAKRPAQPFGPAERPKI